MTAKPTRRAHGIDLLRLVAALQMISGHTVDALIAPEHRMGDAWATYTSIRGLTAVAFLFAAGMSFAMVAAVAPERRDTRSRRAMQLVLISYALHPPVALFSSDAVARTASLRELFAVDVLACIGVALLGLELLAMRLSGRAFTIASALVGLALVLGSPLTATVDATGLAAPLLDYVTKSGGSLFPLFPFAGYAFLGAAIGGIARPRDVGLRPAGVLAITALALGLAAALWRALAPAPSPEQFYAWPAASFARLAVVVAITFVLTIATLRIEALPTWLTTLGGETLFLYVSHLLVLYVGGIGVVRWVGASLSVGASVAAALAMVVACCAAALGWHQLKGTGLRGTAYRGSGSRSRRRTGSTPRHSPSCPPRRT